MGLDRLEKMVAEQRKNVGGDPSVMLRKGIYDKVAAEVILQRYIDFYNSEEDMLVVDTEWRTPS